MIENAREPAPRRAQDLKEKPERSRHTTPIPSGLLLSLNSSVGGTQERLYMAA